MKKLLGNTSTNKALGMLMRLHRWQLNLLRKITNFDSNQLPVVNVEESGTLDQDDHDKHNYDGARDTHDNKLFAGASFGNGDDREDSDSVLEASTAVEK